MRKSLFLCLLCLPVLSFAFDRGLYITAAKATHPEFVEMLIKNAKATGIDTFVVDVEYKNTRYAKSIALIKQSGIRYVARLVIFPDGGTQKEVLSKPYWEKRWNTALYAVSLGASAIQLDYIRYKHTVPTLDRNVQDVARVVRFFREKAKESKVGLQIDIFGVAALKPSRTIGQDVALIAPNVDTINPMVYPSHYEPYLKHAVAPYKTVLESVVALKRQLKAFPEVKVNAYIELFNYRYPMSTATRFKYIEAQMQAAKDAGANGYYVWSANNKYMPLFQVLKTYK